MQIDAQGGKHRLRGLVALLPWLLLIGTAYYWRFGYTFGLGDHDEFIPATLALLDPELFTTDWFVQYLTGGFTVRTPFLVLLAGAGLVMPLPLAAMMLVIACWLAILWALFALAREIGAPPAAGLAGVLAVTVVTPTWTLGGNSIVYGLLAPELVAWALVAPAIVLVLRGRLLQAALLLGLASWFHVLAGFLTALSLGLALLAPMRSENLLRSIRRAILWFGVPYVVVVLPLVALVGLSPLEVDAGEAARLSSFYVLAELRLPHHYLPLAFGTGRYLRFGAVVVLGLAALLWLRRQEALPHSGFILRLLGVMGGLGVAGFVFTELVPTLLVARLQLFKLTVLAQVVLMLTFAIAAFRLLPAGIPDRSSEIVGRPIVGWSIAVPALAVTVILASLGVGRPAAMYHPAAHDASPLRSVEQWAMAETPVDALFLVPPSNTTFRSHAHRSVVVTFKSVPFDDAAMHRWFDRLHTVAPAELPERGTDAFLEQLDHAYHGHSPESWHRIADRFRAGYALVDVQQLVDAPPGELVHQSGTWAVYELPNIRVEP